MNRLLKARPEAGLGDDGHDHPGRRDGHGDHGGIASPLAHGLPDLARTHAGLAAEGGHAHAQRDGQKAGEGRACSPGSSRYTRRRIGREEVASGEDLAKRRKVSGVHGAEPRLHRLQVDHGEDADVVEHRGEGGGLGDRPVRDRRHLCHDEGPDAHDGGHDHAAHPGGRLHGAGELLPVPHALHQGDGEGPGRVNVGDRGAAQGPIEGTAHHGHLGRAAPRAAGYRYGQVHEELAQAGPHDETAEEDEDEDDRGRDPGERAVDPLFAVEVHELHGPVEGKALVVEDSGEVWTDEEVGEEQGDQAREPCRNGAARGLQEEEGDDGPPEEFSREDLCGTFPPLHDARLLPDDVGVAQEAEDGPQPVPGRWPIVG